MFTMLTMLGRARALFTVGTDIIADVAQWYCWYKNQLSKASHYHGQCHAISPRRNVFSLIISVKVIYSFMTFDTCCQVTCMHTARHMENVFPKCLRKISSKWLSAIKGRFANLSAEELAMKNGRRRNRFHLNGEKSIMWFDAYGIQQALDYLVTAKVSEDTHEIWCFWNSFHQFCALKSSISARIVALCFRRIKKKKEIDAGCRYFIARK